MGVELLERSRGPCPAKSSEHSAWQGLFSFSPFVHKDLSMEPIFRLPPYRFEGEVAASALSEQLDWGLSALNAPDFWTLTKGYSQKKNRAVKLAICDTGTSPDHKDLRDRVHHFKDFTGSATGPQDIAKHGTHCSGIACATQNDDGIIGVAPLIELNSYKCLGDDGSGMSSWIQRAIDEAASDGNNVISMSLGSPYKDARILKAIENAVKAGIIVVCAAGNEGPGPGTVGWPGASPLVISVASYNQAGQISDYSSRGPEVDIAAPGEQILSTLPGNRYGRMSGTSMATPFIAGVVCLMIAREWDLDNPTTPIFVSGDAGNNYDRVLKHLAKYARPYGQPGFDPDSGWGFVDPKKLLEEEGEQVTPPSPPATGEFIIGNLTVNGVAGSLVFRPAQ